MLLARMNDPYPMPVQLLSHPQLSLPLLLAHVQQQVQADLSTLLPLPIEPAARLKQAMRYSALNGGKRVRATLVYAAAYAINAQIHPSINELACAVELIHTYSLVHDDLPAMDDDALRRGKPTCHIAFDEATAILAGDALQALAFECLATCTLPADLRCHLLLELAQAAGAVGMVAGQDMDIAAENHAIDLPALEAIHRYKTGALIRASVRLGALAAGASSAQLAALDAYAAAIGLAFQVHDDILDIEGDTNELGKQQGADLARHKSTYPSLLGLAAAKAYASNLCENALQALASFDIQANTLRTLAKYIIQRKS